MSSKSLYRGSILQRATIETLDKRLLLSGSPSEYLTVEAENFDDSFSTTPSSGRITEGADDGITYTLSRSTAFGDLPVAVSLFSGTAIAGDYTVSGDNVDYNATTGSFVVTFKGTQTQASFTVKAKSDAIVEGDETLTLKIDEPSGDSYRVAGGTETTTTITDDTVLLDSLTVNDPGNTSNSATATSDDNDAVFYIEEGTDHKATINISGVVQPDNPVAKARALWRIDEPNAFQSQGNFSAANTNVVLTVIDNNRSWTVKAGVDENKNGTLEAGEVSRSIVVTVVKVESLKVIDQSSGYSATNPFQLELFTVEDPSIGGSRIKLVTNYLPSTDTAVGESILWDVLGGTIAGTTPGNFGGGTDPEVTLTPGAGSRVYDVKIGFDNNADGILQLGEIDRLITVYVVQANVSSITFGATDSDRFYAITPDSGGAAYSGPQWQDNSATKDRDADDAGDFKQPLAYRREATMKVDASFSLGLPNGVTPDGNWIVKGDGPYSYDFYRQWGVDDPNDSSDSMHIIGGTLYMSNEAAAPFPNWIDHFDTFDIAWTLSFDHGATWHGVGTTKNQVYTLLEKPVKTADPLYHTVAHVATRSSIGLSDPTLVTAAIWSEFAPSKSIWTASTTGTPPTKQLTYYANYLNQNTTTLLLLQNGDGQCGAWASFFIDTLRAHAIDTAEYMVLRPNDLNGNGLFDDEGFIVKEWIFAPLGTSGVPAYPYVNFFDPAADFIGSTGYNWYTGAEVTDDTGTAGQGNSNPASLFNNHQVVRIAGIYYDPSAGVTYATLATLETTAIAGYFNTPGLISEAVVGRDVNGDGDQFDVVGYIYFRKNATGNQLRESLFAY